MIVKLLTEHHLEFLSLKGGCRGSSESMHVKKPHCWKSHALTHIDLKSQCCKRTSPLDSVSVFCLSLFQVTVSKVISPIICVHLEACLFLTSSLSVSSVVFFRS